MVEIEQGQAGSPGRGATAATKVLIDPDQIDQRPFDAFPPEARQAVIHGQPSGSGPYPIRVK